MRSLRKLTWRTSTRNGDGLDPSAKGLAEEIRRATRAVSLDYQVFLRDAENDVALGISRVQKVLSFDIMSVSPKQEFREAYGIDLQSVPYMHWWEFQTLFIGLPDNTEIKQRILYRNTDLRDIKDKDERKRVKKIQEAVALKKKKRRKMTDYEIGDMFA